MRRFSVLFSFSALCGLGLPLMAAEPPLPDLDLNTDKTTVSASSRKQLVKGKKVSKESIADAALKAAEEASRRQEISQKLRQQVVGLNSEPPDDHVLLWTPFLLESRNEVLRVNRRMESLRDAIDEQWKVIKDAPISVGGKRLNYGKYTKQTPFIYLADASTHSAQAVVNEVKYVLQSVRTANPQARILLAMEAAYMYELDTPIRFAKQENETMEVPAPYDELLDMADTLNIDILALEDFILEEGPKVSSYKVGNYRVLFNAKDHPDFVNDPSDIQPNEIDKLYGFIGMSTLGMRYRNEQWANYINAVKSSYDIVITYVGNGHTNSGLQVWEDLPKLVGEEYIVFNFYTAETKNQAQQEHEDTAYELLCNNYSCYMTPLVIQPEKSKPRFSLFLNAKTLSEPPIWDGKNYLYIKTSGEAIKDYVKTLPKKQQDVFGKAEKSFQDAGTDDLELANFNVLIPQWYAVFPAVWAAF